ncbi:unnamed protein product [Adineta steineri]|uniref:Uncharacterized protein n=1 Tax=Adineta steineri TaxID=433720 RepID=A0A819DS12_9BILA|nr:unnamed protein product [Adineta steineri]CAF3831254.1 unnamed protein product [Adineta steineri]
MISSNGHKRKSSSSSAATTIDNNNTTITKRFRGTTFNGKIHYNEDQIPNLLSEQSKMMTICNSKQEMTSEYRQLQYELQCQEALLVLMQKLKTNQRIVSQTNNIKQRTTTPVNTTKSNSITPIKQPSNLTNRSTPTKPPHPNQYTVNRANNNNNNNITQQQSSKPSVPLPQATRQSNNSILPAATAVATRLPATATKNSAITSTTTISSSKNNGITTDQHLLSAKLALRKQLEQTLLQIPTPKPTTCDLTYIPGINGWSEFLTLIGLEQAFNTYNDFLNRRLSPEFSFNLPNVCAQCGTDWSVTWHEIPSTNDTDNDEKILCDRCRKTSQKKILKQDHSNRLRQAFMKALQQEKELDAKFQQQSSTTTITTPATTIKQPSSSSSSSSHNKHSNKPMSTKINSNHQSSKQTNNHHHRHHHNPKPSSSKHSTPVDTFASTLAALPTNEQIELFQKHFLSNMFPFAVANQAAALAAKSTQQQQQALAASLPAMAASLMRQGNPAQYLLDMIPQAAKQQQQQQQHHRHSK